MKLLSLAQIKNWESYSMKTEPISSLELMERAANLCSREIIHYLTLHKNLTKVLIFCGPGNNGADGLAIARLLTKEGVVAGVYWVNPSIPTTPEFKENLKLLPIQHSLIEEEKDFPAMEEQHLLIDAIFGIGLNRATQGIYSQIIDWMNLASAKIISIDIPSGLNAELIDITEISNRSIIKANQTLTFQQPKQSFFYQECFEFVGKYTVLDIGLSNLFLDTIDVKGEYIDLSLIKSIIKPRQKFAHKGNFGHALIIAGSYGKIGAAQLSAKAALRTGCGLVTNYIPKVGYTIIQTALPEAMVITDEEVYFIRNLPDSHSYTAVGIGPGLGTEDQTVKGFEAWLPTVTSPLIIDADGINICSKLIQGNIPFHFPPKTILTPHPKEFDRLAGHSNNSIERLEKAKQFAKKHLVIVILKGAHTTICLSNGNYYVNSTGSVSLATAGSGDVLTGIITSLLAQSYSVEEASILGVYLHGLCANINDQKGNGTMIASDIIATIPDALHQLFS